MPWACLAALLAFSVHLTTPGPGWAQLPQVEEEDLDESQSLAVPVQAVEIDDAELNRLFAEAEQVFAGADRPASLPLYGHLVGILDAADHAGDLSEAQNDLLMRSLLRRGDVYLELGGADLAGDTLRRLLELDPGLRPNVFSASLPLIAALDEMRKTSMAEITLVLDPVDADVSLDGRPVILQNGTLWALSGPRTLTITRPGYATLERPLELTAGRSATLELTLERNSAVLRLNSRPQGAEVLLDRVAQGVTSGTAPEGFLPQGAAALYRREEFSGEFVVEGLEPGLRILEVRKPGFRSYRMELQIQDVIDYQMPPVVLEPESGQLIFDDFPVGARILIDGQATEPDVPGVTRPRVSLPPGDYHVTVTAGSSRMFSTRLQLSDRQTMEVQVRLRPGLALLGVLGGDRQSAADLMRGLGVRLADSERWALIDRSPESAELLSQLGLRAEVLRGGGAEVDWASVQARLDRSAPGLLYVLAVLNDDVVASQVDLWIWGAAPAPARPDLVTLRLGDAAALTDLRTQLDRRVSLSRPSFGALVVDSEASPHPIVAHVAPASPAEAAEIQVGEAILGVAGVPVQTSAELAERIAAAESGEPIEVAVQGFAGSRVTKVRLGTSPQVLVRDPDLLESVAFSDLVLRAENADESTRWIIQLNQAMILSRAGQLADAVQILRRIRAPQTSHGVGQATVDYHLGLALERLGPKYQEDARRALERAASLPGARRHSEDEAWLQPRARARLLLLGG